MSDTTGTPLMENEHVKELFSVMQSNEVDTGNFSAMINYVAAMERHLESAVSELTVMRRELADMREIQNHPVKTALQNAVKVLESKITSMREHLNEVKAAIVEGAKNAVAAFKEKGAAALHGVMSFFHIKQGLQDWKKDVDIAIRADDKAISRIEAFSQQYHEVGKAVRNMGRALRGKEAVTEAKPLGKVAVVIQAPYKAQRSILIKLRKSLTAAIDSLEQGDLKAAERKAARTAEREKPSLLERLDKNKERAAREQADRPVPGRAKSQEVTV